MQADTSPWPSMAQQLTMHCSFSKPARDIAERFHMSLATRARQRCISKNHQWWCASMFNVILPKPMMVKSATITESPQSSCSYCTIRIRFDKTLQQEKMCLHQKLQRTGLYVCLSEEIFCQHCATAAARPLGISGICALLPALSIYASKHCSDTPLHHQIQGRRHGTLVAHIRPLATAELMQPPHSK